MSTGYFSYSIIKTYYETFQSQAFSLVIESMGRDEKIDFPSVAVCQYGNRRSDYLRAQNLAEEYVDRRKDEKS